MIENNKGRYRANGATPNLTNHNDCIPTDNFAIARLSDSEFSEMSAQISELTGRSVEELAKQRSAIHSIAAPHLIKSCSDETEESNVIPGQKLRQISTCISLEMLLGMELPPSTPMLSPWLNLGSLAMIYAWRGIGKSWLGLGIGYAVASGSEILGWKSQGKWNVLYIDGELPAATLQTRLAMMVKSCEGVPKPDGFMVITPDLQKDGFMPNLSTTEGQTAIDAYADRADLIIIDNIATLCRSGKENEGESWIPVQSWALRHRAKGRAVLFIHHSGKNGQQRGASRREDVLDTVIALRRPDDYKPEQGARFEVIFEKARNLTGNDASPIEASLFNKGDQIRWEWKRAEDSHLSRVVELVEEGASRHEICDITGLNRFQLKRLVDAANKERITPIKLPDGRSKEGK